MIPVLYDKSERDFSHNGIGFLSDATRATVTEERNGSFELSMQYSISGAWFGLIQNGSIIKAKPNETSEPQLFRVYKVSKPLNGIVTYSAEHISYDLSGVPALGFSLSNTTAEAAMKQAVSGAVVPCPYAVHSDIADKRPFAIEAPASVRSILGAVRDTFGGEFEFDNFSAYLHKARGQDNGVTIEYGKNLTDLKQEDNISDCYTHILPYAAYQVEPEEYDENAEPETVYVYLPEKILPIPDAESLGHIKAYPIDFSDRFEDGADYTEAALRELAEDYLSDTDIGTPKVNLTVSFVQLWQTEEYKNIASLERVKLCDIVTVKFLCLGVESKAEVIKTVFDVLGERYESIALGDVKETLADTIIEAEKEIKTIKKSTDRIESHIKRTDERITLEVLHIVENEKELLSRIELTESSITAEVSRATTEEGKLSSRITQTAESISAEITRATGAEADLSGKIELTAESLTTTLTAKVTEEADRAMKAEKELSSTITQTAESLTSTFTAKITEETDRAGAAEETLSSRITQNAESISAEITRATSAEADLSSNITQTVNKIRLSVSSKTTNDQTESTISITNGTTVLNSVKVTGTTAEQASKIAIDAVNGITLSVTNSTTNASSTIAIKSGSTTISSAKIEFTGLVTFANLKDGKTEISGDNITTGKISADRIDVDKICVTDVYSKSGTSKVVVIATDGNSSLTIGGPDYNSSSNVSDVYIRAQQSLQIGRYASSNNNLYFDINNRTVRPYYSSNSYRWSLGTGTYPFASIYAAKLCIHPDNNTNGEYGIFIHNNSIYSNRTNAYCGTNTYPWAYGYFNSLTAKTSLMAATSVQLGTATNSTVGFYGSTPTTRRTISKVMNPSTATTSQVATVLNNLMTALQAYGLIG